jgi:hypothetical protein
MRTLRMLAMMVAVALVCVGPALGAGSASKKRAKAILEYCHICEACSRISLELVGMLARYPHENRLVAYAAKIATANDYIFQRLKAPPEADKVKEHFGKAVAAFELAVKRHGAGDYKGSHEAGKTVRQEFVKALFEVGRLRKQGVIP